jgi:hypothetical protein
MFHNAARGRGLRVEYCVPSETHGRDHDRLDRSACLLARASSIEPVTEWPALLASANGRSSSMTRAQPSASATSNNIGSAARPASAAAAATLSALDCGRSP